MLVRIVFEIGFGIFNADLATLNSRIHQFGTHIRIQETKLHQNHTLVEKIFFWSKIAFTLVVTVTLTVMLPALEHIVNANPVRKESLNFST